MANVSDTWKWLHLPTLREIRERRKAIVNPNNEMAASMSPLDRLAVAVTDRVGTMGFFLIIFFWTIFWTGYNILASEVPALHWKAFDPFPAFVAYLLMSNVIQILLMPLIMVGQNLQARHSEIRAENDFHVNVQAEQEITVILTHLEHQNAMLVAIMEKLGMEHDDALRALEQRLRPEDCPPRAAASTA